MDQVKIGTLLKELRKEKNLSQEQLAEKFYVSTRTISRWENGNTMPDISVMIELADFYDIDLRELLNGERKSDEMNKDMKETLGMVADYTKAEKEQMLKALKTYVAGVVLFFALIGIIIVFHLDRVHGAFQGMAAFLVVIGFIYSVLSVIKLRQLTGTMNKKQLKKTKILLCICGILVGILAVAAIIMVL